MVLNLCWRQGVYTLGLPSAVSLLSSVTCGLSWGQVISKPAVFQWCLLLLLFISGQFVLIPAVVLNARDLLAQQKRALKLPYCKIPLSKLFVTFVSEFCCGSFVCCCQSWWIFLQICGICVSGWITAMTGNFFSSTAEHNSDSLCASWGHLQHPLNHAKAKLWWWFFVVFFFFFFFFLFWFFFFLFFCLVGFFFASKLLTPFLSPCTWIAGPTGYSSKMELEIISLFWAGCLGIALLLTCYLLQGSPGRETIQPAVLPPTGCTFKLLCVVKRGAGAQTCDKPLVEGHSCTPPLSQRAGCVVCGSEWILTLLSPVRVRARLSPCLTPSLLDFVLPWACSALPDCGTRSWTAASWLWNVVTVACRLW